MKFERRFSLALLPAAACLACSTPAWADDEAAAPAQVYADAAPSARPETIEIKAAKQPYRKLSATGATKTDTLLKDLPQSVRVISADLLADAGVTDLNGALDLGSGIARQNNFGGLWNSYSMRGFTGDPNFGSDYMVNGFNSSRGYNGLRDGVNTSTVEILKGPSSALYGRGEPGGTVNITTKKPLFEPAYTVGLSGGSFNTWRSTADLTGPLSEQVAYRLNAAYEKGDSFRDTISSSHYLVSPSLLWMPSPNTTVSYELEAVNQSSPFDRGVLAVNGKLGAIPVSRFLGEPGDGDMKIQSLGHQVFVQHDFNDQWSLQTGLSYRHSSLKGVATEAWSLEADNRTLRRQRRARDNQATDLSGRLELLGKLSTGPVLNNLLVGVDAYRFEDDRRQSRGRSASTPYTYTIDIYDPVYGSSVAPAMTPITATDELQRSGGLYAQDQMELSPEWKALVGLRYDRYKQRVDDLLNSMTIDQDLHATSPRAGLVYQPLKRLSLYASAAKGFRPNSGVSASGSAFPAEQSRSYEVGAKLDSPDGRLSGTLAAFSIRKKNVLTADPADPNNHSIAVGEVESKGLELDLSGQLARQVRVSAAYAYTSAQVTKSTAAVAGTGLAEGRFFPNVPRHSANVFANYDLPLETGGSASVGAGVFYTGARLGSVDVNDDFKLPAYTTVRLVSAYSVNKQLRVTLDVDNLFNRRYYASSYSQLWVYPGSERKLTLGAQYSF